jgi:uncharacterized protein YdeI (YjbR/CyaY-like superfamily)
MPARPPAKKPAPTKKTATSPAVAVKVAAGELPILAFADAGAWGGWLAKSHASSSGVWLRIARKDSGQPSVTYAEAVERALVWGWIDGQKRALDETAWLQKFTPRGRRSAWSKINRDKALALIAAGEMRPSGLAEVERAKKDGRWEVAYESQSKAVVPPDLAAALASNPRAARFFETLESYNRYAVLYRIQAVKKPETRAARVAKFIEMLARHEKIHPTRATGAKK